MVKLEHDDDAMTNFLVKAKFIKILEDTQIEFHLSPNSSIVHILHVLFNM